LGRFKKNCQDADCRIKQTEPYSPWQNAAKSAISKLKKAAGRKMVRAGAPKPFWVDAIKLEAYICSNTAHDIFILQGEVPETVMLGETSNISQFCKFTFYDWIMFHDQPVAFPGDNPVLGPYPHFKNPHGKWGGYLLINVGERGTHFASNRL
jgi:hypothetical protein